MHRFTRAAIASLALGLMIHGAEAADMNTIPPEPMEDWSGFYVGLHAGWGWADIDHHFDEDSDFFAPGIFEGLSIDADGPVAGAQAGVNWQLNNFLLGLEADISWTDIDGDFDGTDLPQAGFYYDADSSIEWLASIRGRAGVVWNQLLLYGTGGVAFANVDTDVNTDGSGDVISNSDTTHHTGFVFGGGVEMMFTSNITGRLEFLHYEFNNDNFFMQLATDPDAYDSFGDIDLDVDVIRAGVNVLF